MIVDGVKITKTNKSRTPSSSGTIMTTLSDNTTVAYGSAYNQPNYLAKQQTDTWSKSISSSASGKPPRAPQSSTSKASILAQSSTQKFVQQHQHQQQQRSDSPEISNSPTTRLKNVKITPYDQQIANQHRRRLSRRHTEKEIGEKQQKYRQSIMTVVAVRRSSSIWRLATKNKQRQKQQAQQQQQRNMTSLKDSGHSTSTPKMFHKNTHL